MHVRSRRPAQDLPPLTAAACILCVIVFLMLNTGVRNWGEAARWGYFPEDAIYRGKWWALVTSAFVHLQPLHLFFNLYWLWILGGALERTLGSLRWLLFVLTAAFVSSGWQLFTGESGIGMSGVGYALFGFGWLVRKRYPEFARIVTPSTAQAFLIWGAICIVGTYTGALNIGNGAHVAGLLFGAALGAMVDWPRWRAAAGAGLALLAAGSVVPLFWNPLSVDWVSERAYQADLHRRYPEAVSFYRRVIAMKGDQRWAWRNLERIYANQENATGVREAKQALAGLGKESSEDSDD